MKRLSILLAALPLAGCISFAAKPPPSLLTLDAAAVVPVGADRSTATAPTIVIGTPQVPQALAVARVPVQTGGTAIAYVKDAQWVEPPAALFARLLTDTITANTPYLAISPRQALASPGAILSGELRRFGIDAGTHEAVVTYDATLVRAGGGAVETRRFEARVPVSVIDASSVGPAIGKAANQVAAEVAAWAAPR